MAMGGGTWLAQNKTLPGAYINFVSVGSSAIMGERGIVTLPLNLNWGPDDRIFRIDASDFNKQAMSLFGYAATAPELLLVREALKRAKTLLVYRINGGGSKASLSIGGVQVTANCSGVRGNDIKIAVQTNIDDEDLFDVITYLDLAEVDRQTVAAAGALKANAFVGFGGDALSIAAAQSLGGGSNGSVTGNSYAEYLNKVEVEQFQVIGYPGSDVSTQNLIAAFVKRLRDDEGYKIVGVLANYDGDYEGLINVKNGVKLNSGEVVTAEQAVAWVAGATAGAAVNESLTNTSYDGAIDVDIRYSKSQYEAAIQAGQFAFYADGGRARVLSDVNSLTSFTSAKTADFASNQVVRVLDGWGNDVARIFNEQYLGTTINSESGRMLFKADLVSLAGQYQRIDAISQFVPEDIEVQQGEGKRDVLVQVALTPNDSMEKLYMTVTVA